MLLRGVMRLAKSNILHLCLLLILLLSITSTVLAQSNPDLIVHYVEGQPKTGEYAYDVAIYFSAFQGGGDPIRDLNASDVNITEDGKPVEISGLALANADEAIHIVIAMDTSGSMRGPKMDGARIAAAQFISGLGKNDLAAIMSFNSQVKTEIGFTNNLADASEKVDSLNALDGAGTCFYDALYEAITLTTTIPIGRRAIIILTDGVDELPSGKKCSKYHEDDVINLAKSGGSRVPIYTVGLGSKVDSVGLQRIADSTGGQYQFAVNEQKLDGLFRKLLEQLRSEYRVTYISKAAPGPHQLVVETKINDQPVRELRDFVLPNFPYSIVVNSPKSNEPIIGKTKFIVQVLGQGDPIAKVEFLVNGKSIGSIESPPYELDWQPTDNNMTGNIEVTVIALGTNGSELARNTLKTTYILRAAQTPIDNGTPFAPSVETATDKLSNTTLIVISVLLAILALAIMIVLLMIFNRRREKKKKEVEWQWSKTAGGGDDELDYGLGEEPQNIHGKNEFLPHWDSLGILMVLESDDPALNNQHFEITKQFTTLGRKVDNDIIFPKDSPVSRHHAVIEERNGDIFFRENLAEDDESKRPAYGTFINDKQLEEKELVKLNNGDEIRLGKRLRLRFQSVSKPLDDDRTIDELEKIDGEKGIE